MIWQTKGATKNYGVNNVLSKDTQILRQRLKELGFGTTIMTNFSQNSDDPVCEKEFPVELIRIRK